MTIHDSNKCGIIACGNWIIDKVKLIDRWPAEGELCNILQEERSGGGGPCNVLFDLAAMCTTIPLHAIGRIGCDADGDYLLNEIKKRHINASYMVRDPEQPTSYTDVMSGNGRRTFFHCRGANAALNYENISSCNIKQAKVFYLGYLLLLDSLDSKDVEYGTVGAKVLHLMQERGFMTVVDFVSEAPEKFQRVVKAALPYIDVLVVNELEAGSSFNLNVRSITGELDMEELTLAGKYFMDHGVKKMVVVHYPEGAMVIERGSEARFFNSLAIERSEIAGTVGAGDAFCAGILYGIHEELDIDSMIKLANASAHFNLRSASASGGAVALSQLQEYLAYES